MTGRGERPLARPRGPYRPLVRAGSPSLPSCDAIGSKSPGSGDTPVLGVSQESAGCVVFSIRGRGRGGRFIFGRNPILKKKVIVVAGVVCALVSGAQEGLRPGGLNRQAFFVDDTKKMEEVLRENESRVAAAKHKYAWSDFIALLDELADSGRYVVCPGREFIKTFVPGQVVVYMRHDVDVDPATALRMAEEENKRGLKASYYILTTAPYYGLQGPSGVRRYADMDRLYRRIQSLGHEIGVHNDLLSMMLRWDIDPLEFQRQELDYYRQAGFPVVGVVSHGSSAVLRRKLNNMWVFSEFGKKGVFDNEGVAVAYGARSFKEYGFIYEGYRIGHTAGTSDIAGFKTGREVVDKVRTFKAGDRVSLLTHPIHWGDNGSAVSATSGE